MSSGKCIERAGILLIRYIWLEKVLVDFLILKQHPRLIKKINKDSSVWPRTFISLRLKLWKEGFAPNVEEFIEKFRTPKIWSENLRCMVQYRNMIAHGKVSIGGDYILYRPSGKRKKLNSIRRVLEPKVKEDSSRPTVFLLRLSDDYIFQELVAGLSELDEVYLPSVSASLGFNYQAIR